MGLLFSSSSFFSVRWLIGVCQKPAYFLWRVWPPLSVLICGFVLVSRYILTDLYSNQYKCAFKALLVSSNCRSSPLSRTGRLARTSCISWAGSVFCVGLAIWVIWMVIKTHIDVSRRPGDSVPVETEMRLVTRPGAFSPAFPYAIEAKTCISLRLQYLLPI